MEQDRIGRIINSNFKVDRRKLLGFGAAGLGVLILNACGSGKKSPQATPILDPDCTRISDFQIRVGPQDYETPSQVEITQDQILTEKDLDKMNVKVFNFSHFPGEIKFTTAFIPLIDPIKRKGARLRVIFVDDTPNKEDLSKAPLKNLANLSDEEIERHKDDINKKRKSVSETEEVTPNATLQTEMKKHPEQYRCIQEIFKINQIDTGADNRGLASADYSTNPATVTVLISLKHPSFEYDQLKINDFRTVPIEDSEGASILNKLFHEIKHASDFIELYTGHDDPKYKSDFDENLEHDLRLGEKRALDFAAQKVREVQNGALPPIVIYDDKGKMLEVNTSTTAT